MLNKLFNSLIEDLRKARFYLHLTYINILIDVFIDRQTDYLVSFFFQLNGKNKAEVDSLLYSSTDRAVIIMITI